MVPALTTLLQQVERKVQQTQRRQSQQLAFSALPVCLTVCVLLGLVGVLVLPFLGIAWTGWELIITVATLGVGVITALAIAWWKRPDRSQAAFSLDQAFGLDERIVTLTTLRNDQQESEAAQLLAGQMHERVAKIEVAQQFPYSVPRRSWYAPLGATLALILALFFPATGLFSKATKESEKNGNKEAKAA